MHAQHSSSCSMDGDRSCARSNWQVRSGRWNSFMLSRAGSGVCCGHVQHAHVHVHVHGRMSSASDEFPHELFPSLLLHAWIRQTDYSDAVSNHVWSSHGSYSTKAVTCFGFVSMLVFPLLRQQHKVSSPNRKSKHERGERRNMGVDLERPSEKERSLGTT